MASTYGLGGAGLSGFGVSQRNDAMQALSQAADTEQRRNESNRRARESERAGNAQLASSIGALGGAAIGAQYGSVGGPMGMAIGSVVGALAGSLF